MQPHSNPKAARERERLHRHHPRPADPSVSSVAKAPALTSAILAELTAPSADRVASIYLPTHRTGSDSRQDHIRLKNLMAEVLHQAPELKSTLHAAGDAVESQSFWAHPAEGLVWFLDKREERHFWLPETTAEMAIVSHRRHIKPLLPLLAGDGVFHLLELHQHGVRLHVGTRFGLHEIPLPGVPTSVDELSHVGNDGRDVEVRTLHAGGGGSTMWFGGAQEEDAKELAGRYFRAIDAGVRTVVPDDQTPLVLAGVEWLIPVYREANHHPRLLAADISMDTTGFDAAEIHRRAWELVSPLYAERQRQAVERHAILGGTGKRAEILSDILSCAPQGRISSLLIAADRDHWGSYVDASVAAVEHAHRQPGDEDLLNVAAVLAMRTGAEVWAIPAADLPGGDLASAILRY